jgi:flagellar L-ring protein precursor FlgH
MRRALWHAALIVVLAAGTTAAGADSLYDSSSFHSLTADHRAHRVGDVLTVLVYENSSATTSADTSTDKSAGLGISTSTAKRDEHANLDLSEKFAGKGKIERSGRLLAQLTVTVRAIAPNGDMIIGGKQLIAVNDEKQHIELEGRVRPIDVDETNTVISSRIADAKISYLGDGLLGEKQHPGFLTRILSWLGVL